MNKQLSVSFLLILSVSLSLIGKEGGGWARVSLVTSSQTTILRFTSHDTSLMDNTLIYNTLIIYNILIYNTLII